MLSLILNILFMVSQRTSDSKWKKEKNSPCAVFESYFKAQIKDYFDGLNCRSLKIFVQF